MRVAPDSHLKRSREVGFRVEGLAWHMTENVKQLATCSGFQVTVIQNVYKHVSSFKQTEKVIKAIHTAALECAKEEIKGELDVEDLYVGE